MEEKPPGYREEGAATTTGRSWRDRFTATGRPIPLHEHSSIWERSCPWGLQAPFLPPFKFTDESIIPVIVRIEDTDFDKKAQIPDLRPNMLRRLKCQVKRTATRHSAPPFVCVFMPRREYHKHFAYDSHGNYIGTEEQRSWSREELDEMFGSYQKSQPKRWVTCKEDGREFMTEDVLREAR